MSRLKDLCIDCADPWPLAHWWAKVLGYRVRPYTEEDIRDLEAAGFSHPEEDPSVAVDPIDEPGPSFFFNRVPEGNMPEARVGVERAKQTRIHLDVRAGDDRDAVVARCLELGATRLWDGQQGPSTWVTMADPEGNEFCVT